MGKWKSLGKRYKKVSVYIDKTTGQPFILPYGKGKNKWLYAKKILTD